MPLLNVTVPKRGCFSLPKRPTISPRSGQSSWPRPCSNSPSYGVSGFAGSAPGRPRLLAAALLLLAAAPLEVGEQRLDALRGALQLGRGGLVLLALVRIFVTDCFFCFASRSSRFCSSVFLSSVFPPPVRLVEPRLVPLDVLLLLGDAEQDAPVLPRDAGQEVHSARAAGRTTRRRGRTRARGRVRTCTGCAAAGRGARAGRRAGRASARAPGASPRAGAQLQLARRQLLDVLARRGELALGRAQVLEARPSRTLSSCARLRFSAAWRRTLSSSRRCWSSSARSPARARAARRRRDAGRERQGEGEQERPRRRPHVSACG